MIGTNLTSTMLASKAAHPHLKASGHGRVINNGSMLSIFGLPFHAAYGASKGGVVQLTKSLAVAWAADGITVNVILPGWIDTDLTRKARERHAAAERQRPGAHAEGALGRDPGISRASRPSWAVDASAFITGVAIPVDGGFSRPGLMPSAETLLVFAALSLGLALTPGPNMLYLVSRSLAQGTRAGMVSLVGCQAGSLAIMLCAAAGITAALLAIPYAWDVLRLGGAAYLAFLAWQCLRPGGQPLFSPRPMPQEPAARLFAVGFATAALNPKVALFYMAVLPPFLDPARGNVFLQGATAGRRADRGLHRLRRGAGLGRGGHRALPRRAAGLDGGAALGAGRRARR